MVLQEVHALIRSDMLEPGSLGNLDGGTVLGNQTDDMLQVTVAAVDDLDVKSLRDVVEEYAGGVWESAEGA